MTNGITQIPEWVLARQRLAVEEDPERLGSIRYVDQAALRRGIASVSEGQVVALGRPAPAGQDWSLELMQQEHGLVVGRSEQLTVRCHGTGWTHLDALNHIGVQGSWYEEPGGSSEGSLMRWARSGLVTRALCVDIPAFRGVDYVAIDQPVTGDEIGACLTSSQTHVEPGDALLLYMGRDRFESLGKRYPGSFDAPDGRPGIGATAADWIADHKVGLLGWDFLDSRSSSGDEVFSGHYLVWAVGQALIDNCDLAELARRCSQSGQYSGLFIAAPLPIPDATGCMINPLVIL